MMSISFLTVLSFLLVSCASGNNGGGHLGVRGARSGARAAVDLSRLIPARGRGEAESFQNDEALLESLYTLVTTDLLLILGRTEDRSGTLEAYIADATEGITQAKQREGEIQSRLQGLSDAAADLQESEENLQGDLEDKAKEDSAGAVKLSSELAAVSQRIARSEAESSSLGEMLEAFDIFRAALEMQVSFLEQNREEILSGTFQGELPGIPYLQEVQGERE